MWAPVFVWMALIFLLSARPHVPGIERVPDLVTHGLGFLVLSFLLARAMGSGRRLAPSRLLAGILVATLYGVSDEAHQAFVPGRHSDPWDVGKDALGAALGALAYHWVSARQPRTEEASP